MSSSRALPTTDQPLEEGDLWKSMPDLVRSRGYSIEEHEVITEDGYILGCFRIPRGKDQTPTAAKKTLQRPVVLLQHALLDSSFAFVGNSSEQSLGYVLADAGFDVWFGNNRGNTHSRRHVIFQTESDEFWDFTYDDMALYDLPAEINYILKHTGASQLAYIGHSQGTLQAFAGLSQNRELASKVCIFIALAPVAYMYHQIGYWGSFLGRMSYVQFHSLFAKKQFLTQDGIGYFLNRLGPHLCSLFPSTSGSLLEWVCGPGHHIDGTRIPVFVRWTPAGTSVKNMLHFEQSLQNNAFRMYDYGRAGNVCKYGTEEAPLYQLSELETPTAIFTGDQDYMCHALDVERLVEELESSTLVHYEEVPGFSHLDFTWGLTAHQMVYPQIVDVLREHPPSDLRHPPSDTAFLRFLKDLPSLLGCASARKVKGPKISREKSTVSLSSRPHFRHNPRASHSCWSCIPQICVSAIS